MSANDMMTTKEAATYVGLAQPTLERFRVEGQGPRYYKLGGAVRYSKQLLDEWLERNIASSTDKGNHA